MTYIDKATEFCLQHQVQKAFGKAGDMLKAWTEPSIIWLEFNLLQSLVVTAPSLKSKVEQVRGGGEKCDAEAGPQRESSRELCAWTAGVHGGEPLKNDIGGVASVYRWVGEKDFIQPLLSKDAEERQDGKPSVVWNIEYLKSNMVNKVGVQFVDYTGSTVNGQDLRKGSQILAADGALVEVTHPPEMSEKRGKVVLRTAKVQLEVTADHRVVNVTREGAQRQVSVVKLSVGDLLWLTMRQPI